MFRPLAARLTDRLRLVGRPGPRQGAPPFSEPEPFTQYGGVRGAVRAAIAQRRAIEFTYRGTTEGTSTGRRTAFPVAVFSATGTGSVLMAAWVVPPSRSSGRVPGWRTFALRGVQAAGAVVLPPPPDGPPAPRFRPSMAHWRSRGRIIIP